METAEEIVKSCGEPHEQASKDMFEEEFVEWILAENIIYKNGIIDYERGKRWFRTLVELYQYWKTNVRR